MNINMVSGSLEDLAQPNTVIVSRTEADGKGLSVGSAVDDAVREPPGSKLLTLVGTSRPTAC